MNNNFFQPARASKIYAASAFLLVSTISVAQYNVTNSTPYTVNYLPVWNAVGTSPTIKNSEIFQNTALSPNGFVGIGTSSQVSGEYLGVRKDVNTYMLTRFTNATYGTAANVGVGLNAASNSSGGLFGLSLTAVNNGYTYNQISYPMYEPGCGLILSSGSAGLNIGTNGNSQVSLWTSNARRLSVTGNGLVGIGTTSPQYSLDVTGMVNSSDMFRSTGTGGNYMLMGWNGYNNIVQSNGSLLLLNYGGQDVGICTGGSGVVSVGKNLEIGGPVRNTNIAFNLVANGTTAMNVMNATGTQLFGIANDGSTFINSTSATISPLIVKGTSVFAGDNRFFEIKANGTTYAREIYVQTTAFPDYVFAKGYQLMPLSEVKNYIDAHQHLPNIPCAKEVTENGQNVGKIQIAQMEKIEELYLYVIELNKKVQSLEEQNKKLTEIIDSRK